MKRHIALLIPLLYLLSSTPTLQAQDPTFLIESVRVDGTSRTSSERIIAESYMAPGITVTEREIELAVRRVQRLPFVYEVSARLERGSAPGTYVLVLEVIEVSPIFVNIGVDPVLGSASTRDDRGFHRELAVAGYRWFLGDRDVAYGALGYGGNSTNVYAGWTRYGLFGGRGWAALDINRAVDTHSSYGTEARGYELQVNYPTGADHGVRLRTAYQEASVHLSSFPDSSTRRRARVDVLHGEIGWYRDTTDDPLLPRRGTSLWLGVGAGRGEELHGHGPASPPALQKVNSDSYSLAVSYAAHRPITESLALHLTTSLNHSIYQRELPTITVPQPEFPVFLSRQREVTGAKLGTGISGTVWNDARPRRRGELWWEVGGEVGYSYLDVDRIMFPGPGSGPSARSDSWEAIYRAGLAYRSRFGLLRLVFAVGDQIR